MYSTGLKGNAIVEHVAGLAEKPTGATMLVEIFANYDCDITQKDICGKMLDSMSNIAQGRFQRADHTSVITPQQEASLRRLALETRVKLLRNLNRTIEAEVKLEGIAQA